MLIAADDVDLHCPLCNYSLRGLVDPRCPECGFAFEWAELREAARNKHPYLFEHGAGRNLRTFWLTFWRDCRPRRFWRELSPAHPIHLRRMIVYWILSNLALLTVVPVSIVVQVIQIAQQNAANRASVSASQYHPLRQLLSNSSNGWKFYAPLSSASLSNLTLHVANARCPLITTELFWTQLPSRLTPISIALMPLVIGLLWPWATITTLLIFQGTMRRVGIRNVHLLRAIVYASDAPLILSVCLALIATRTLESGWAVTAFCVIPIFLVYRLYYAYRRYLRFDWPLATVLVSQLIVGLFVMTILANLPNGWLFQSV